MSIRVQQLLGSYWKPTGLEADSKPLIEYLTRQLTPLVESEEFRGLAPNDRQAAIIKLSDSLNRTNLLNLVLTKCRLNPTALVEHLSGPSSHRSEDYFSELGNAYYHHLVKGTSQIVIRLADRLACYVTTRDRIILNDLGSIVAVCERFTKQADTSDQRRRENETNYLEATRDNLDRADYFGIPRRLDEETYSSLPLHIAYISLRATALVQPNRAAPLASVHTDIASKSQGEAQVFDVFGDLREGTLEDFLSSQPRLVIQGEAGSGKTTLLRWLASRVASAQLGDNSALPPALMFLREYIPFYIPLREHVTSGFPAFAEFPIGAAPQCGTIFDAAWVTDQLSAGRAIVLIDAVDELPPQSRSTLLAKLRDLVRAYPEARYIITARPTALDSNIWPAWGQFLQSTHFSSVSITELTRSQRDTLIDHWHAAAADYYRRQQWPEATLSTQSHKLRNLLREPARLPLRRLATNPLLCAMLCYLHLQSGDDLPEERVRLYETCVTLLLSGRDLRRQLWRPPLPLSEDQRLRLLADLAWWAVGRGDQEGLLPIDDSDLTLAIRIARMANLAVDREALEVQAASDLVPTDPLLQQLLTDTLVLRDFIAQARSADFSIPLILVTLAREARQFFVERSNLLREPVLTKLAFAHRTLHEFLAAVEAVDAGAYPTLVSLAAHEQWRELIILAVGRAPRAQAEDFVLSLISQGSNRDEQRHHTFLAVACLETARDIDQSDVLAAARAFLPPQSEAEAMATVKAGDPIVPLLAPTSTLSIVDAIHSIRALQQLDSPEALRQLAAYGANVSTYATNVGTVVVRSLSLGLLESADADRYAQEALTSLVRLDLSQSRVSDLEPLNKLTDLARLDLRVCLERVCLVAETPIVARGAPSCHASPTPRT